MSDLESILERIRAFREARDWSRFHTAKNLAVSISIEAAELLERLQWVEADDAERAAEENRDGLAEELADVLIYALLLADRLDLDPLEIVKSKIDQNERKYPVKLSRGTAAKYDRLGQQTDEPGTP